MPYSSAFSNLKKINKQNQMRDFWFPDGGGSKVQAPLKHSHIFSHSGKLGNIVSITMIATRLYVVSLHRPYGMDFPDFPASPVSVPQAYNHVPAQGYPPGDGSSSASAEHEYHSIGVTYRGQALSHPRHSPPLPRSCDGLNGSITLPPADYR